MLKAVKNRTDNPFEFHERIPDFLRNYTSIVASIVSDKGKLIDCNEGFFSLFKHIPTDDLYLLSLDKYFLQPYFHDLNIINTDPNEPVYQGLLSIGDPDAISFNLTASIYYRNNRFYLIGEHNIEKLDELNSTVTTLNDELATAQRELIEANKMLEQQQEKIEKLKLSDPLTNLPNQRACIDYINLALSFATRQPHSVCIALCDIDLFKQVNEIYGHEAGDSVIKTVARILKDNLRSSDYIARMDNEEFAIILSDTKEDIALDLLNRVRKIISMTIPPLMDKSITASFGVTSYKNDIDTKHMLKNATLSLADAKTTGKNKVVLFRPENNQIH